MLRPSRASSSGRENGINYEPLASCTSQYMGVPFCLDRDEQQKYIRVMSEGGSRFPAQLCLLAVGVCILFTVFLMPFLALYQKGPQRLDIPWWKRGSYYYIQVASFYDSDGDGVGDIRGIINKLDYIESLGVVGIELSPFYSGCGIHDEDLAVTNHTDIQPEYGSMQDLEDLISQLHDRDMKLVIPLIPNHTSDKHPWFRASTDRSSPFSDFYIWHSGTSPPNNWESRCGGSAWTRDQTRGEYYYHKSSAHKPDLNYHNPAVQHAMNAVFSFWLKQGVDGVRIEGVADLLENTTHHEIFANNVTKAVVLEDHKDHRDPTSHQPGSLPILAAFIDLIKTYARTHNKLIPLIAGVSTQSTKREFWFSTYRYGADMPDNTALSGFGSDRLSGHKLNKAVEGVLQTIPFNRGEHWITWNTEEVGVSRSWTQQGGGRYTVPGLALTLLLPGSGIVYYGQELGLPNLGQAESSQASSCCTVQGSCKQLPHAGRGLMQWTSGTHAGFSTASKTWIHPHPSYSSQNVQKMDGDHTTPLHALRSLIALRLEPAFMLGQHNPMIVNHNIYSFCRLNRGRIFPKYLVTMNIGEEPSTDNYQKPRLTLKMPEDFIEAKITVPANGTIVYHSHTFAKSSRVGEVIDLQALTLFPGQVLVLKL